MRVHLAREMTQSGAGWQPQGLHTETVRHGASVPWVNREHHDPHRDVQQRSLEQDATVRWSFTFTFRRAGTYRYHCNIHREMTGMGRVT